MHRHTSSALTLLVLLAGASLFQLSTPTPSPITAPSLSGSPRSASSPLAAGDELRRVEERGSVRKGGVGMEEEEEEEDELFKDVDPKMLAAVLLEALNKPQATERRREGEGDEGTEEEGEGERGEVAKEEEEERGEEVRAAEGESQDRDRDGRQELEMVMAAAAAQGKEEREREEEEERKKAQEEEERLTEKVISRTMSQTVPVKAERQSTAPNGAGGGGEEAMGKEGGAKDEAEQGATSPADDPQQEGEQQNNNEEEEQLSPEELKNLEKIMEEFQSYNMANKRERDSQQGQRESRGYSPYNDILRASKGYDLPMSKKKLKWQEETQKGMNFPTFRGGNFMDDFNYNNVNNAGGNRAQPPLPPPAESYVMEEDDPEAEEDEEEEEALSPEEEEAQAKAEQEEMRRQAAEAQRAKMEEEKLADIASDMLLQYMVKQNAGRKYKDRKYSSSLSNAAEDKRSDEEQEVTEDDDDIDPQTIDKLIEISSKLHLPADDVVDIISDVERKKKKDVPPESLSPWQQPLVAPPSSFSSSTSGVSTSQFSSNRNSNGFPSSKQAPPSPAVNPLKAWFQEKTPSKSLLASQDLWMKTQKPLSANQDLWLTPQRPMSTNQDLWLKPHKSFRTSYPPYSPYPSYYQQKPYRGYYPIYFPSPPKPKPRYYVPKPSFALNNLLGNSADYDYNFPPRRRFRNWVQPRPRKPPASLRRNPYYGNYVLSPGLYSRTYQPVPVPKPRSLPRLASVPPHRGRYYYSPPGPLVTRDEDYYGNQIQNRVVGDNSNGDDDLANYLAQILMKQPRRFQ